MLMECLGAKLNYVSGGVTAFCCARICERRNSVILYDVMSVLPWAITAKQVVVITY